MTLRTGLGGSWALGGGTQEVVRELWGLVPEGGRGRNPGFLLFPAAWMGSHLQTGEQRAGQRPAQAGGPGPPNHLRLTLCSHLPPDKLSSKAPPANKPQAWTKHRAGPAGAPTGLC